MPGCNGDFMESNLDSVCLLLIVGEFESEEDELVESESADDSMGIFKIGVLGFEFVSVSSSKIHEYPSLAHCCIVRISVEFTKARSTTNVKIMIILIAYDT